MRLSTADDRDDARAIAVIRAALDAGARWLDTADAYARDERERGHNERLIARALADWSGDRARLVVATKGGLTRPDGRWLADGRARHLEAACDASLRALARERIDLYQLHAPDPRVPLATSVRALARLRERGLIRDIGLCNVTVAQIEEARAIAPIASVQVALSAFDPTALRSGVAGYCARHGLPLLAHTPLGGPRGRAARDPLLASIARARGVSAEIVALGYLLDLHRITTAGAVIPLVGATRVETAAALASALALELDQAERDALAERFAPRTSVAARRADGEVLLLMGIPGAGKSRLAARFPDHRRLSRDERGGRLDALARALDHGLASGERRWLLDASYASRASRQPAIAAAAKHGVPVRCLWLDTPLGDAQANAVRRLLRRYGELPTPEALRAHAKRDPHAFDPRAQFRYQRELEPPSAEEGFVTIERIPFAREPEPGYDGRALLLQLDGLPENARARLDPWQLAGYRLLGFGWAPSLPEGPRASDFEVSLCPHPAGPPRCWCRTPLPGLALAYVERHRLDPAACLLVGKPPHDRTLAERAGMRFLTQAAFFSADPLLPETRATAG